MEQSNRLKIILDSLGGWEMLQLCLRATSYKSQQIGQTTINYIDGELRIYSTLWRGKVRVYAVFGVGGRNEYVDIILKEGFYNKDFVGVVERVTQLKLDLF